MSAGDSTWQIKHSATTVDGSPCFYCANLMICWGNLPGGFRERDHGRLNGPSMLPSGYVNSWLLKMTIEIVDFPINRMVIFHSYVSLPEGK